MNENLTKSWQKVSVGGVLFAVCCVVGACATTGLGMLIPMLYNNAVIGEAEIMDWKTVARGIYGALDMGVLAGSVLIISGLGGILFLLSDGIAAGMRKVGMGMFFFAVVGLMGDAFAFWVEHGFNNTLIINLLNFFFVLAGCGALGAVQIGFGQAGGDSGLSARMRGKLRNVRVATNLLFVIQLVTLVSMLLGQISFSMTKAVMGLMIITKPGWIVGYILLAVTWWRWVRALRDDTGRCDLKINAPDRNG